MENKKDNQIITAIILVMCLISIAFMAGYSLKPSNMIVDIHSEETDDFSATTDDHFTWDTHIYIKSAFKMHDFNNTSHIQLNMVSYDVMDRYEVFDLLTDYKKIIKGNDYTPFFINVGIDLNPDTEHQFIIYGYKDGDLKDTSSSYHYQVTKPPDDNKHMWLKCSGKVLYKNESRYTYHDINGSVTGINDSYYQDYYTFLILEVNNEIETMIAWGGQIYYIVEVGKYYDFYEMQWPYSDNNFTIAYERE